MRSIAIRLWERVDTSAGLFGCWPVAGAHTKAGYGVISRGGRDGAVTTTNRVALEIKLGRALKPGMFACHTCDNPPCCNPAHLFEGTHQDNVDDMRSKGRGAVGDRNGSRLHPERLRPRSKLTPEQRAEIHARVLAGEDRSSLAREYGVSRSWAYKLVPARVAA